MGQATDPTMVVADSSALSSGTVVPVRATNRGSLRVAQAEPSMAAGVRNRYVFSGGVVANAVAPVQDAPTTAAAMGLYNANTDKSCFIEQVAAFHASGTAGLGGSLHVCKSGTAQAADIANATGVVQGRLGGQSSTSLCTFGTGITLTTAGAWFPVATGKLIAEVNIGFAMMADLGGRIEIPPGFILGMTVVSPAGTNSKFTFSVIWSEYQYVAY